MKNNRYVADYTASHSLITTPVHPRSQSQLAKPLYQTHSMDFPPNIKLTSNDADYDPQIVLSQLRKNRTNHFNFDCHFDIKAKKRLSKIL